MIADLILGAILSHLGPVATFAVVWCLASLKAGLLLGPLFKRLTHDPSPHQGALSESDRVGGSFIHNGTDI